MKAWVIGYSPSSWLQLQLSVVDILQIFFHVYTYIISYRSYSTFHAVLNIFIFKLKVNNRLSRCSGWLAVYRMFCMVYHWQVLKINYSILFNYVARIIYVCYKIFRRYMKWKSCKIESWFIWKFKYQVWVIMLFQVSKDQLRC